MEERKMNSSKLAIYIGFIGQLLIPVAQAADVSILNVSYDPTRELYQEFNAAFAKSWQAKGGDKVDIKASHGGSPTRTLTRRPKATFSNTVM